MKKSIKSLPTFNVNVQQGDVCLTKLGSMPAGEQKKVAREARGLVVAHGESGHFHVVEEDDAELIMIGERMLLNVASPAVLNHEEHGAIAVSPGLYEVTRVREFDYLTGMSNPVRD